MNVAVITGASSGMGREFVYAIDKDMELDELWVIARREDRLLELQDKVRAKMAENAKKPKKKSGFMARLEEAQRQQQAALREQEKRNKKNRRQ